MFNRINAFAAKFTSKRMNAFMLRHINDFMSKRIYDFVLNNQPTRDRWIQQQLENIPPGKHLLDAGAGPCMYKKFCAHLKYTAQDFNQQDYKDKGWQPNAWDTSGIDITSDIASIPRPDASFDVILCSEVLEHVPNPVQVVEELDRLLVKEGLLILTAPFISNTHYAPYHFCTGFNRFFYEHHLGRLGYDILELSHNGNFFEQLAQEIWCMENVVHKYVKKELSWIDSISQAFFLLRMHRLSKRASGTEEFLCHGLHVIAKKNA